MRIVHTLVNFDLRYAPIIPDDDEFWEKISYFCWSDQIPLLIRLQRTIQWCKKLKLSRVREFKIILKK